MSFKNRDTLDHSLFTTNFRIDQFSYRPIFVSTNFRFDQFSFRPIFVSTNFRIDQFSFLPIFVSTNFRFDQFSYRPIFVSTNFLRLIFVRPVFIRPIFVDPHLSQDLPHLDMVNRVKRFAVIDKAHIDFLLVFSGFFYDPTCICNDISGSSTFSETSLCIR